MYFFTDLDPNSLPDMLLVLMGRISFYPGKNILTSKSISAPNRRQLQKRENIAFLTNDTFLEKNDRQNIQMMMRTTKSIHHQKPT